EPNAGAPNVDGVLVAERFFLRIYFSQRNHAVDLLRARCALPHDLFHRADAGNHSAWRKFFRILAEPRRTDCDVQFAVHSLRAAVPEKDRVTCGAIPVRGARALACWLRCPAATIFSAVSNAIRAARLIKFATPRTPPPARENACAPRKPRECASGYQVPL